MNLSRSRVTKRDKIVNSVAQVFEEVDNLKVEVENLKDENSELRLKALNLETQLVKKDSECRRLRREMDSQRGVANSNRNKRIESNSSCVDTTNDIDSDDPLEVKFQLSGMLPC